MPYAALKERLRSTGRRIAGRSLATPDLDLASRIVDPEFYFGRNDDVRAAGVDPVWHYAAHGWREGRDPNPFTMLQFVLRHDRIAANDFSALATHLIEPIFHNPLMRRRATLEEIRAAVRDGGRALRELFVFDVEAYAAEQHDVLAAGALDPVTHLFHDGLLQNRLRNAGHLHPALVPQVMSYASDHEFLAVQAAPLTAAGFHGLSLGPTAAEAEADLSRVALHIGVVLYRNSSAEVERLVHSIRSNAQGQAFGLTLHLRDNSPGQLPAGALAEIAPDLCLRLSEDAGNAGFARGHNALMQAAFADEATHYLGLNPDGHLLPGSLAKLLRFAVTREGPALVEMDSEPISHPKWYHPVTGETDWVSGAAFLIDRQTWERTGGFDPEHPMYCEDVDLSFRARMSGSGLYVSPRARWYHDTSERLFEVEPWRRARMLLGEWYLSCKWNHPARARRIGTELSRQGIDDDILRAPPKPVTDIPPEISQLMKKARFAASRYWEGWEGC